MAGYEGYEFRCGYCGNKGDSGRCVSCGSGMDHEDNALEGAKRPDMIKRWLSSRDRAWEIVDGDRAELWLRRLEDLQEGRDPKRFDGLPDPFVIEERPDQVS